MRNVYLSLEIFPEMDGFNICFPRRIRYICCYCHGYYCCHCSDWAKFYTEITFLRNTDHDLIFHHRLDLVFALLKHSRIWVQANEISLFLDSKESFPNVHEFVSGFFYSNCLFFYSSMNKQWIYRYLRFLQYV